MSFHYLKYPSSRRLQHDYDCFTRLALRTQKGRHSLSASGITKSRNPRDRMGRRTLGASVIGDKVYIPGSPVTTLPELLKEAETTIAGTPPKLGNSSHLFTPVPRSSIPPGLARSLFEHTAKERVWTKEEWKLLDACFTDERVALGPGDGQIASVDEVNPEHVARRFGDMLGGEDVINKWGEDWKMCVLFLAFFYSFPSQRGQQGEPCAKSQSLAEQAAKRNHSATNDA